MAIEGDAPMFYVNLTFSNAIAQMFDLVLKVSEDVGLAISHSSKSAGEIYWTNGSSLFLRGNATQAESEKFRGFKARLVIIDECQSQRWLRMLVDEIISPLIADFGDKGRLVLQGTPPRIPKTYFEVMYSTALYKSFNWEMADNPHIPDADKFINNLCEKKGIAPDSAFIMREFHGVLGAYDTEAMVYKGRKYYETEPAYRITDIAIGIDYGFSDFNAIIGLAYNRDIKQGYFFFEEKFNKSNISQIVAVTRDACEQAKRIAMRDNMDLGRVEIVADTNEESITFELATTYSLPARNAYKYNKELAISHFADALRGGQILMKQGGYLDEEMDTLIYFRDEDDNILPVIDDEAGGHPDAADAGLYAFRQFAFNCGLEMGEAEPEDPAHTRPINGVY
jgi:hypothetical protein